MVPLREGKSDELLAQQPLFQTVTRIEEDAVADAGLGPDLHPQHIVDGGLSATAMTGRLSGSQMSNRTTALLGSSAPRQRRGRKAATAVSARTSAPMGSIGP